MLPVLKLSAERVWVMRELIAHLSNDLGLSLSEREMMIPSGTTTLIANRIHWAKTHLKQAGLVEQPKRAHVTITARGRSLLSRQPTKIDSSVLLEFSEFRDFLSRTRSPGVATSAGELIETTQNAVEGTASTPEEQIASASTLLDTSLRESLLERVLEGSPTFFEKVIVDLLLAMGYGGSRADAGQQLGGTGDGGVDGVIREDQLGLDRVYLQAKRYQPKSTIGSETVHAFMGALLAKGAQKGVLITTSAFTRPARDVAAQPGHLRIVLIDGEELTKLMVRFGVGVRVARTVEVKRVDLDYFDVAEPD